MWSLGSVLLKPKDVYRLFHKLESPSSFQAPNCDNRRWINLKNGMPSTPEGIMWQLKPVQHSRWRATSILDIVLAKPINAINDRSSFPHCTMTIGGKAISCYIQVRSQYVLCRRLLTAVIDLGMDISLWRLLSKNVRNSCESLYTQSNTHLLIILNAKELFSDSSPNHKIPFLAFL